MQQSTEVVRCEEAGFLRLAPIGAAWQLTRKLEVSALDSTIRG